MNSIERENDIMGDNTDWEKEELALKGAIEDGAFDNLDLDSFPKVSNDETRNNQHKNICDEIECGKVNEIDKSKVRALEIVSSELMKEKNSIPWMESFDIIPSKSFGFGDESKEYILPTDIHDDLKRETIFYNITLEAIKEGRKKCEDEFIPYLRPDDFFAEMIKTDNHMAKIKDRLIYERKKMEATEKRKIAREKKLRVKDAYNCNTSKGKRSLSENNNGLKDMNQYLTCKRPRNRQSDAYNGGKLLNTNIRVRNKKRMDNNSKYGFGGKKRRFKQKNV